MRDLMAPSIAAALVLVMLAVAAMFVGEHDGKRVYEESCARCHSTGREGAPRLGDREAWAARSARGLDALNATALAGIRKMPPHGGRLSTTNGELERAVAYIVEQSR